MPPSYADKRARYSGAGQWEFSSGTPRGDNPIATKESQTKMASRGSAPRDAFRISTTENPELLMQQAIADDVAQRQKEALQKEQSEAGGLLHQTQSEPPFDFDLAVPVAQETFTPEAVSPTGENADLPLPHIAKPSLRSNSASTLGSARDILSSDD